MSARGSRCQHVGLAYLESRGRVAKWNFDSGRYDSYEGISGEFMDPQTRQVRPDAELALLGEFASIEEAQRRSSESICAAAHRLGLQRLARGYSPPDSPPDGVTKPGAYKPRTHELGDQLSLLEEGLRLNQGYLEGWDVPIELAVRQELDVKQVLSLIHT